MRMMRMTTGLIPVCRAVEGAVQAMAMTMMTARVRRTRRAVRKVLGKGRENRMGRGKGRGRGRETVKGKVLFNTPQEEMICLVPLLCSCRRKCQRQTWTWRAN
jgi:MarR-like DNA-binding transcriptional regulator SgrR of sgrS sRNA